MIAGLPLVFYSEFYFKPQYQTHGIVAFAGVLEFVAMVRVIRPEAASDPKSAEFIQRHMADWNYRPNESSGNIIWGPNSPIELARTELNLPSPVAVDRWAGVIGRKAIIDYPFEFLRIGLRNIPIALTTQDIEYMQKRWNPGEYLWKAFHSVYGVDVSSWPERVRFALKPLIVLLKLKFLLAMCLAVSLWLFIKTGCGAPEYFLAMVIFGYFVSLSFIIFPEERHFHLAENLCILNSGILLGDWTRTRRLRVKLSTSLGSLLWFFSQTNAVTR